MKQQKFSLSEDNYYTLEADKIYCSASQYLNIIGQDLWQY